MYLEFFGLKEKPFSLTPDPRFFFQSDTHRANLEKALYGIRQREGFIVVTGTIGAGKTTLCRTLHEKMDRKTHTAMVLNPFLSDDELLEAILHEFGVLEKGGQRFSKKEMLDRLSEFLINTLKEGKTAILIIDEAQNLPMPALEQIRILSNLETDTEKLLNIILVGQLGLLRLLKSKELEQLDQRISVKCQIDPLKKEEVQRYIEYRLTVSGSSGEITFSSDALYLIYQYSLGIPRIINLICDRALLEAYTLQTTKVEKKLVLKAVENLKLEKPDGSRQKSADLAIGVTPESGLSKVRLYFTIPGVVIALAALGFLVVDNTMSKRARADIERRHRQEVISWQIERDLMREEMTTLKEQIEALRAVPPATSPVAVPEELEDSFTIFLGTFEDKDTAVKKSASLANFGYKAYVIGLQDALLERKYRLVLGSFKEREEAEKVLVRLHGHTGLQEAHVLVFSEALRVN